jgi:TolB-like protein
MIHLRNTNVRRIPSEPDAIKRQLQRVLDSSYFRTSKQLSCFLRFVVEESLCGRSHKLSQYAIAINLGRDESFDPNTDPVIRIEARRLRQTLALYYQQEGQRDSIRIEIPTGRYVPVFRQNSVGEEPGSATELRSGAGAVSANPVAKGTEGPSIALLNFTCLGQDRELEEIAISLTEELSAALSCCEFIKLIRPIAAEGFLNDAQELEQRNHEYRADYVLDGKLQRWGEEIRLFSRLCDPVTGELIWSESFSLSASDKLNSFSQDRLLRCLAATIADFHGVMITHWANQALRLGTVIPEPQQAFIRFRYFHNRLDRRAFSGALQACENALKRWPDDALAHSLFANLCVVAYFNESRGVIDSPLQRAEAAACDAVALQPGFHFPHFTLGKVYFAQRERGACLAEFERSLQLNPYSASIAAWIGMYHCLLGEWESGIQLVKNSMAQTLDAVVHHFTLALAHYRRGAYDFAWTEARRVHAPDLFWDSLIRAACLGQLGRCHKAQRELAELLRLCPDFKTRGQERMQRLLYSEENVAMLMDGLRKAGLDEVV